MCKMVVAKIYLRILKSVTCLCFSNTEEFTKVETLAASGGIFQKITLYVVHTKLFV